MQKFNDVPSVRQELVSVTCDICQKEYTDVMDIQEFHQIYFTAGYASVFGDGSHVECDICQHCLKEKLGEYLKVS
jgi:antitoxin CcdA